VYRERKHLQVDQPKSPRKLPTCDRASTGGLGVVSEQKCEVRLMHREQRVLRAIIDIRQQSPRPLGPPRKDRHITAEHRGVTRELTRQSCRAARITTVPIQPIRPLAGLRLSLDIIKPPARPTKTLERLG
jgi:hypothetical protein